MILFMPSNVNVTHLPCNFVRRTEQEIGCSRILTQLSHDYSIEFCEKNKNLVMQASLFGGTFTSNFKAATSWLWKRKMRNAEIFFSKKKKLLSFYLGTPSWV